MFCMRNKETSFPVHTLIWSSGNMQEHWLKYGFICVSHEAILGKQDKSHVRFSRDSFRNSLATSMSNCKFID